MGAADREFARRAATALLIAAVGGLLVLALVLTARLYLLLFGGILLAVLLRALADALSRATRLTGGVSYALVVLALAGLAAGGAALLAPGATDRFDALARRVPELVETARSRVRALPGGEGFLGDAGGGLEVEHVRGLLSISFRGVADLILVLVTGLYVGAKPAPYVQGLVKLVPLRHRERASEVLGAVGHTLRWFLLGRLASMIAVGVLTGVGLGLLGVPLAALLGVVAGALTFVPYAGPIAAALPIGIAALAEGPGLALWALLFYTGVQSIEGFVITPLVQERVVSLPPALTLAAEFLLGMLLGPVGVIVSVPLAAALLVVVDMVYVEDVLGDAPPPDALSPEPPGLH